MTALLHGMVSLHAEGSGTGIHAPAGHEGGAAAEELSRALATGIIGGALQQYFTASLGESAQRVRNDNRQV